MVDQLVLSTQVWVNQTYAGVPGYVACPETGKTGWSTVYSLTRALQHELGITALSDSFGPTTMAKMVAFGPVSATTYSKNRKIAIIAESGLYCKGYSGGSRDGSFDSRTQAGIQQWKTDMGITSTSASISAKEMKALLSMDAYTLLYGGESSVREVQQWMNSKFISRSSFDIVPCDGYFSRNVQKSLILAIQYSLGMSDSVANGSFGPATKEGLRTSGNLQIGSTDGGYRYLVQLFKAALIFNKQGGVDWNNGTFSSITSNVTKRFQQFCHLSSSGAADYQTWCSLLVSTGDPSRKGEAFDCMQPLNADRLNTVKANGYKIVGRYISGGSNKILTRGEIGLITGSGISIFPIYQEYNNALTYFDEMQGLDQGAKANASAINLSIPEGTIIYFAVDVDATSDDIQSHILPYFRGVKKAIVGAGSRYRVGVYGSRNVCSKVSASGLAESSFVSGMSTGFSGNLGFALPANWAFDQISNFILAEGTPGQIEIDNNIVSGRDRGFVGSVLVPILEPFMTWIRWVEDRSVEWKANSSTSHSTLGLVSMYLRNYTKSDSYIGATDTVVFGPIATDFIDYCDNRSDIPTDACPTDPFTGSNPQSQGGLEHFGASVQSLFTHGIPSKQTDIGYSDIGGWAGDLVTFGVDVLIVAQRPRGLMTGPMHTSFGRATHFLRLTWLVMSTPSYWDCRPCLHPANDCLIDSPTTTVIL
ncbi:DUF1906 domain-containing protein [Micrococcus luteus]|nr:DUF1906 domain-containing protein [Micrococcus luteus]